MTGKPSEPNVTLKIKWILAQLSSRIKIVFIFAINTFVSFH